MFASKSSSMSALAAASACLILLAIVGQTSEAKLLRSSRYYDNDIDSSYGSPYGGHGGAVRTGERAIVTVRGARDNYSGLPPRHLTLESSPYGPAYPRGIYDRLDTGYGAGGRRPLGLMNDLIPVGAGSFSGPRFDSSNHRAALPPDAGPSPARRADFLDPDFGVKASFNLARRKGGKCQVGAEADSEIPELGLDSGRLNVDCDLNPIRMAGAAYKAAKDYGEYRRAKKSHQPQPSRIVKRKRTSIHIDRDYERARIPEGAGHTDDDDDGDSPNEASHSDHHAPVGSRSSAVDASGDADEEDDD